MFFRGSKRMLFGWKSIPKRKQINKKSQTLGHSQSTHARYMGVTTRANRLCHLVPPRHPPPSPLSAHRQARRACRPAGRRYRHAAKAESGCENKSRSAGSECRGGDGLREGHPPHPNVPLVRFRWMGLRGRAGWVGVGEDLAVSPVLVPPMCPCLRIISSPLPWQLWSGLFPKSCCLSLRRIGKPSGCSGGPNPGLPALFTSDLSRHVAAPSHAATSNARPPNAPDRPGEKGPRGGRGRWTRRKRRAAARRRRRRSTALEPATAPAARV